MILVVTFYFRAPECNGSDSLSVSEFRFTTNLDHVSEMVPVVVVVDWSSTMYEWG